METVLKAHKVRKVYGSKGNLFSALGSISLEIQKGSFVGIMGPSGLWEIYFIKCIVFYR